MIDVWIASLLITALVLKALGTRLPWALRLGLGVLVLVACSLPYPYGASHWLLSYLSSLSITTGVIALAAMLSVIRQKALISPQQFRPVAYGLVITAVLFYPLSLGFSHIDPYGWAFSSSRLLMLLLLPIGILAWIKRYYLLCWLLIAAQISFYCHLLSSDNVWDYLLDPILAGYAVYWLIKHRRQTAAA